MLLKVRSFVKNATKKLLHKSDGHQDEADHYTKNAIRDCFDPEVSPNADLVIRWLYGLGEFDVIDPALINSKEAMAFREGKRFVVMQIISALGEDYFE